MYTCIYFNIRGLAHSLRDKCTSVLSQLPFQTQLMLRPTFCHHYQNPKSHSSHIDTSDGKISEAECYRISFNTSLVPKIQPTIEGNNDIQRSTQNSRGTISKSISNAWEKELSSWWLPGDCTSIKTVKLVLFLVQIRPTNSAKLEGFCSSCTVCFTVIYSVGQ